MSAECGPRYLRVKRKSKEEPCYSSRQYKRCKYIASVKTNLLQDVLKIINNQNILDSDIVDVNQVTEEENFKELARIPPEEEESSFRGYVYDIYCLQDLDNKLYCVNEEEEEEEEETDDIDSNDENNSRNDYPDDEGCDYNEINYYKDWEYEDEHKLEEKIEAIGMKGKENSDSSSEGSFSRNCDNDDDDDEEECLEADNRRPVPLISSSNKMNNKRV